MRHEGEVAVQRRAGVRDGDWGSARAKAEIPPVAADFLARQRMLVIGAADDQQRMWAGLVTGEPGFARALDERTLEIAALPAEPLDLGTPREVGMIAVEFATRRRMRVNGLAHASDGRLVVRTDQVYANCPKYLQTRYPLPDQALPRQTRTSEELDAGQRRWIESADTFFVATHAPGLGVDASHRGGNPGFVKVDGRKLIWPDYVGNSMYMTLGNLHLEPACGLLFLDWESGGALHLTGRARVVWGERRQVEFELAQAVQVSGASPLRWRFGEYSRHNP